MMQSRGITVLEVALALAILAPALFAAGWLLSKAAKTALRTESETRSGISQLRLRAICARLMEDLDSHRLPVLPRIHKNGLITFSSGDSNPVMQAAGGKRPAPDSDAITGYELDLLNSQKVLQAAEQGEFINYMGCSRFQAGFRANMQRSWAGLLADGIIELVGAARAHPGRSNCHDFSLRPGPSMSFTRSESLYPQDVRLLIPLKSHYTWYVDEKLRLRYLSHAGEVNLENQPVINRFGRIHFELKQSPAEITFLTAEHQASRGRRRSFHFNNHLSRLPVFNLLLNQP